MILQGRVVWLRGRVVDYPVNSSALSRRTRPSSVQPGVAALDAHAAQHTSSPPVSRKLQEVRYTGSITDLAG